MSLQPRGQKGLTFALSRRTRSCNEPSCCCTALTGDSIRVHLEARDVVPCSAVTLCAHAAPPGAHGRVPPSLVDLVGDHFQVPERRPVLGFGLGQPALPLVHVLLEVLEEQREERGSGEGRGRCWSTGHSAGSTWDVCSAYSVLDGRLWPVPSDKRCLDQRHNERKADTLQSEAANRMRMTRPQ